ncbi:MAG: HU family DNA-binding protein [Rickettsiaceae bacterium H1]|nr:HU family DNA-binding protein [Rickettsiaceae bacterium H1]
MTKVDIIESINFYTGFSKADSRILLNQLLESSIKVLQKDKELKIKGFGTFKVMHKKSRIGRNPKTKETVIITARNIISFRPSRQLKKVINEARGIKKN